MYSITAPFVWIWTHFYLFSYCQYWIKLHIRLLRHLLAKWCNGNQISISYIDYGIFTSIHLSILDYNFLISNISYITSNTVLDIMWKIVMSSITIFTVGSTATVTNFRSWSDDEPYVLYQKSWYQSIKTNNSGILVNNYCLW